MIALTVINEKVLDVPVVKMSKMGIGFVTTVVAFLLVSRVNTGLARYNAARDCLTVMFREQRELTQNLCVFSQDNTDTPSKEWRHEVAYRCLILLRVTMAVIDYQSDKVAAWQIPELNGVEKDDIMEHLFVKATEEADMSASMRRWAHDHHGTWTETLRTPVRLAYMLKKSIHSQEERLTQDPISWVLENKLLTCVDRFMAGYYGIRQQITTVRSIRFEIDVFPRRWS